MEVEITHIASSDVFAIFNQMIVPLQRTQTQINSFCLGCDSVAHRTEFQQSKMSHNWPHQNSTTKILWGWTCDCFDQHECCENDKPETCKATNYNKLTNYTLNTFFFVIWNYWIFNLALNWGSSSDCSKCICLSGKVYKKSGIAFLKRQFNELN